jgi:type I restriction enzyme M protein
VRWNPVEFGLPQISKNYNITYDGKMGRCSDSAYFNAEKSLWYWDGAETKIIAWAEHPIPYNRDRFPYGAVIGDIVGSIYEFNNIKTKDFPFWSEDAFFTDDTVMTIAVYISILKHKKNPAQNFKRILICNMQRLGKKYPNCSYGFRFGQWLESSRPVPYNSYGNGSAMRVSAAAFLADNLNEAIQYARESAEVTHNHPYGIDGAVSIATGIYMAKEGKTKEEIKSALSKYWDLNFSLDDIRPNYIFDETCQGTVPAAIVAFLEAESFEDSIRNAISIGGDSDTIAAITGSLAEAYYGISVEMKKKALCYLDDHLRSIVLS